MNKSSIVEKVKYSGLVPMPVYYNTLEATLYVLDMDIPGDFVECGVFAGAQVGVMALASAGHRNARDRKFHLFDSFEGIPEAGPRDNEQPGIGPLPGGGEGRLVTSGVSACSVEQVQGHMERWGVDGSRLVYWEGWFQDTVKDWPCDKPISLLRLDGDLYESTMVCLEHLYPRLSRGGICIADDCTLKGCAEAMRDYFSGEPPKRIPVPGGDGCEWWRKQ